MRRLIAVLGAVLLLTPAAKLPAQQQVDSVSLLITNMNPRVGDNSTVSVVPKGRGGLTVQGARCAVDTFPGPPLRVLANGSMTATGVGPQVITGRCGALSASATITVRPRLVNLSLQKGGTGSGSLFADPFLSYGYDEGTVVTITATPLVGSQFAAWTGCNALVVTPQRGTCQLTMNGNQTVVGFFNVAQQQSGNQNQQAPRARRGNTGGTIALIALAGVAAYGTGVYLKTASLKSGQCISNRTCIVSAFGGPCDCAGSPNGPCDFSGTPGGVGANCNTGGPCRSGLSCNNGRCEDRNGRCPY